MKTQKKIDGLVEVWKRKFEDSATRLELNVIERAVYSHLLWHTRLEGKLRLHFFASRTGPPKSGISRGTGARRAPPACRSWSAAVHRTQL